MNKNPQPLKILGAGPAGLTAAINLIKAGFKVEIYEKNRDVGRVYSDDLQGLENWSDNLGALDHLRQMNIAINFDCTPFSNISVFNGSKSWDFSCNKPAFYLVRRGAEAGCLDYGLKSQALDAGVTFRFKDTLPEEQADIIATGPQVKDIFAVDKGIAFKTGLPDTAIGLVNDDAAFKGYSYLLTAKGYGCMCTVLFDKFSQINSCFQETRKIFSRLCDLDIQQPQTVIGIGSFTIHNRFQNGKRLYVGEAAGIQDLLWGFGIRSAVTSGFLAAQSLIHNESYQTVARKYFTKKLKASLVNRYLWEKFGKDNYEQIIDRIDKAPDSLEFLNRFYNYNFFQKLAYPFAFNFLKKRYHISKT